MIRGTEDTRYAFANGIVRAREARLLTRSHFDRLIAGSLTDISAILSDSPYAAHKDVRAGLEAESIGIYEFFKKYCQTPTAQNIVDWPEQIHNLKVRLKQGSKDLMFRQEMSEIEEWPEIIHEIERFAVDKDPFILSTNLDKILCKYLYEISVFAPFFTNYFLLFFDLENIRSFFRARQFEKSKEIFAQVFIEYGTLKREIFVDNLLSPYDVLGKVFFVTPYSDIIEKGSLYIEEHHSFLRLERLCDEMKLEFLKQARKLTFGIEPLFSFYEFKKTEIKKLRQILWGKINEVIIDDLKESIPDVW